MRRARAVAVVAATVISFMGGQAGRPARAQEDCSRAVVFTLPSVTWEQVERYAPPALLAAAREGAAASMSVRTIDSRTSYASGFATIGGGSRIDAGRFTGAQAPGSTAPGGGPGTLEAAVEVAGLTRIKEDARAAGYDAVPGALGSAVEDIDTYAVGNADTGLPAPLVAGYGRWTLLAAMDADGVVDRAAVSEGLLAEDPAAPFGVRTDAAELEKALDEALADECGVVVVDQGDLARVDEWEMVTGAEEPDARGRALAAADAVLEHIRSRLDPERDLLLIVTPTSPWVDEQAHLGVAIAVGPGFDAGSTLQSASTRRTGIVTLPDVAPTILEHLGRSVPPAMTGRAMFPVDAQGDVVDQHVELDRESVFVENMKTPVTASFVIVQVLIYMLAIGLIARRARASGGPGDDRVGRWAQLAVLGIVAFPISAYIAGAFELHTSGRPGAYALLVAIDAALILPVFFLVRDDIDRLLVLCGLTTFVLFVDLLLGAPLQLNAVFGYSPIVAGRFAGLGNIAFAVLGVTSLITGVLIAYRWKTSARALAAVVAIFAATVIFDGAPQLGSDVGGVLALVPSFAVTLLLLTGRRVNWKLVAVGIVGGVAAVGAFLALDLSRPSEQRTHLARLYEDVRDRGFGVMVDTIERKTAANVRLFKKSLWTYFVPPALIAIAVLMRRPRGRWVRLSQTYPQVRAGLIGGLVLAALGFAVNDSGIVIPAVMLSFLVPMAVIVHLRLDAHPAASAIETPSGP